MVQQHVQSYSAFRSEQSPLQAERDLHELQTHDVNRKNNLIKLLNN